MIADNGVLDMLAELLEDSHLATLERLPELVQKHAVLAGLSEVSVYLVDLQQNVLRLLTGRGEDAHEATGGRPAELRVEATLAGRAFQEVRVLPMPVTEQGQAGWWVPLLNGTERLGVLQVRVAEPGESVGDAMRHLASLVALMLVSLRTHSDSYARLVRSRPMHVAAEMQWQLTPPLTFATEDVTIAAVMEPAYEVGGDAYDYALGGDIAHLAVFDAMGHDVAAGLTASLAMAACRNHRRRDMDLIANSEAIESVLIAEFGRMARYVTAIMAELNVRTGQLSWVNRGHHPPVVIRGGRWATVLECPPSHPLGLDLGLPVTLCQEQLEPGDRVLFFTDGIIEAGGRVGSEFGLHRLVDFMVRHSSASLPVPETLRRLIKSIMKYHKDQLDDDATVLLAEWHGPAHRRLHL
ncbi:PP2C family protein-serine/threonine phosphatase [Nonomuraea sp. NPDC048916]|uniref:PP2C family protein-serine/threonine phosphatase n=1 Tax=Nonomuraea sp. NPDC048916 TaxID=3154232 RepID=UPI003405A3EA